MNKFEIIVDLEESKTIIKDLDTGIEIRVSLNFTLGDCIALVMKEGLK